MLRLPNTTLWGLFESAVAAQAAFDSAIAAAEKQLKKKIKVRKRVITKLANGLISSDRRKPPEDEWKRKTSFETCRAHQLNDEFFKN